MKQRRTYKQNQGFPMGTLVWLQFPSNDFWSRIIPINSFVHPIWSLYWLWIVRICNLLILGSQFMEI